MTLDLIESIIYNPPASKTTKTKPKSLIKLHIVNKGVGVINISKIINDKNVQKTQFNKTEQISAVYTLTKTIWSKIFNYKETIKTINTKDILDYMNNLPYNCTTSPFTDPNHGHIVTWDICIVQNELKNLLCKGPKYREPVSINFSNFKTNKKIALDQGNWSQ